MTPSDILTMARNKYNSVGDSFYSDSELLALIYEAEMELAVEAHTIEASTTASTVISTQAVSAPTGVIDLKRVTYQGAKLKPITFREDDALTILNSGTAATGTPQYYVYWDETIYLRPVPDAVGTLTIYSFNQPSGVPTLVSTLDTPSRYHLGIVNFLVSEMCLKDENLEGAQFYALKWEKTKTEAKKHQRKQKVGDGFRIVQDDERLAETILGSV